MISPDVIFVHSSLRRGGAEVLRQSILPELASCGVNFRVCLLRERGGIAEEVERDGVPVDFLRIRGSLFDVAGVCKLANYIRQHRPLIIQSSQFVTNFQSVLAGKLTRTPITITEEHGLYEWKRWYHRLLDRRVISRATTAIACSKAVQTFACSTMQTHSDHVRVIHNCAGPEFFAGTQVDREKSLQQLIGQNSSFVVGIVGSLRKEKGHHDLLATWEELHENRKLPQDAALLVIGDGPLRGELEQIASRLANVFFLGEMAPVVEVLNCLDLFVLPSRSEGFGIAIVEAMLSRIPVIATRVGGIPEIIRHGENGLLVTPGNPDELSNAILTLFNSPNERNRLSAQAFHEAQERFVPQRYVAELIKLYRELFKKKQIPVPASWLDHSHQKNSTFRKVSA